MKIDNLDVKVNNAQHSILINYELMETSSRKLRSIDRGDRSDRYSCEFTFRGTKPYIQSIVEVLDSLRASNSNVVLSECEENYFGENVNHTNPISTKIFNMGKVTSPVLNVYEFTVDLLASNLTFTGTPILPQSLHCLQSDFECYSTWNTHINETYFRNNTFVDYEADIYTFTGRYIMDNEDIKNLLQFNKVYRGGVFEITEPVFGVSNMFGFSITDTTHDVIITNLEYSRISPILFDVNITLVRQG